MQRFWCIFVVFAMAGALPQLGHGQEDHPQHRLYHDSIRPILAEHCFSCHNGGDNKGGLNLQDVYFIHSIVSNGPRWAKLIEQVRVGDMPPSNKPRISPADQAELIEGVEAILDSALSIPDPGQVVMRRLSNREYRYSVQDLLGVDFDAMRFFPADGSGGEGFDNQAKVLYITALQMERYLAAADSIVASLVRDDEPWSSVTRGNYAAGWAQRVGWTMKSWWTGEDEELKASQSAAASILQPLATRAFRRLLTPEDKQQLASIFEQVYSALEGEEGRYSRSLQESIKYILVSPHFLYRREADLPLDRPYEITSHELASRLSYFLWSSLPDDELLRVAYEENLHDPDVMRRQVDRMLTDPRSKRFSESFAGQWFGVDELLHSHQVDPTLYPAFSEHLAAAMYQETISFFHHVVTERRNFLDLLDSDYTFLNQDLAEHYGIDGIEGDNFQRINWPNDRRGGILGQGGVLTVTSLPTRTSPVLRGKWVLEELLGTPPLPPPPDVPELEPAEAVVTELDLRALLSQHRAPSACFGCHQKMDPLGLGLEQFDATGKWREAYGDHPIDASGVLPNGDAFDGPAELRQILVNKKDLFARNLARKLLSFGLGRSVRFQDKRSVDQITRTLLENNFDTQEALLAVALSYPFRYKKSDRLVTESTP